MLDSLKQKFGRWILKRTTAARHHDVVSVNWNDVRNLGVIYNAEKEDTKNAVKKFTDKYSDQKKIRTLGYYDAKKLESSFNNGNKKYEYFCKADLNWYYKPVSPQVVQFIHRPFDVLINMNSDSLLQFDFIIAESHALLIAGRYNDNLLNDMMIKGETENMSDDYLLEQIVKYLKMIKPK